MGLLGLSAKEFVLSLIPKIKAIIFAPSKIT